MRRTKQLFLLFISLVQMACNKESAPDFVQTTGELTQVERTTAEFNEIELNNSIDLVLTQDTVNRIIVEAGRNLIPDILTDVNNGKMVIKNSNKFNFLRSYKKKIRVLVHYKKLIQLTYRGAGNISCTNTLNDSVFTFDNHKGTGDIQLDLNLQEAHFNIHTGQCYLKLSGSAALNYLYQAGNGYTDAGELQTGYTFVTNKGTNDLKVNAGYLLYAQINYLGNVYYKGTPTELSSDITDKGKLIKIEE